MLVSAADQEQIEAAIAAAEKRTSGEIVAVVAGSSASYLSVAPMAAALLALLVPWPLIEFTWWRVQDIYLLQLLVFAVTAALLYHRPFRMALVPNSIKRDRAHKKAMEQFVAQNLYTTSGHTGVMIFLSEAERYAEVVADQHIYAQVPQADWQALIDRLTTRISDGEVGAGLSEAITAAGDLLAAHFPPGSSNPDELPNHLIVIE